MESLTTSELARTVGVNIQTIRYYERTGLLPTPPRTESGYRQFPEEAAARLRFIRNAQAIGFSLNEIRDLISLRLNATSSCADIQARAREKVSQIEDKIGELRRIKKALESFSSACSDALALEECQFLEHLDD